MDFSQPGMNLTILSHLAPVALLCTVREFLLAKQKPLRWFGEKHVENENAENGHEETLDAKNDAEKGYEETLGANDAENPVLFHPHWKTPQKDYRV